MYSLVLMAAMSAGPEVPEFGGGGIGWDTSLCVLRTCRMPYCAPVHACFYDTCMPARYGWTAGTGCCGAYRYGGCYGVSYGSCFGGNYGYAGCGCGMQNFASCGPACGPSYGCGGCGGGIYSMPTGCHGSGSYCSGYGGGCMNYDPSFHGIGYAGFTGYGNFGAYGSAPVMNPAANVVIPTPSVKIANPPLLKNDISIPSNKMAKSSIILEVPENAKVFVDDQEMTSKGSLRVFTTPEMEVGQDYYYVVRVVFEANGKTVEENRKVIVRPGDSAKQAFIAPTNRDTLTSGLGR